MKIRFKKFLTVLPILSMASTHAYAQARYDNHEMHDEFALNFSVYQEINHQTKIRIDSDRGLGTLIDLEDRLNVDDETGSVFRLDGYYRFNQAHRIDFAWYNVDRAGQAELVSDEIVIRDRSFQVGSRLTSETEAEIFKIGYAWSFINVEPYEFYVGVGLNVHDNSFDFESERTLGEDSEVSRSSAEGSAPLPTFSLGARVNLTGKLLAKWRYEVFAIEAGDYGGRFQESALSLEHNTWEHVGFGFGLTTFTQFMKAEDTDYTGEVDSNYLGYQLYLKTYF